MDNNRYRLFMVIVYPESLPVGWLPMLSKTGVKMMVSPLHDRDYDDQGTLKKPHYHVLCSFDGKKSISQVKRIFKDAIGYEPMVKYRNSKPASERYMCHLDNDEKARYNTEDVQFLNGYTLSKTPERLREIKREVLQLIFDNYVVEYSQLVAHVMNLGNDEYFDFVTNHTVLCARVCDSLRNSSMKEPDAF